MRSQALMYGYGYYRLSDEEYKSGESSSIANQRMLVEDYCNRHGIALIGEFVDDGFTGANFERPGFQQMLKKLEEKIACVVITKDLSRLGRDMREASYYAEEYFPLRGIRYLALADNFDTDHENVMAPFQFAMNEVYLRDGSRKVKDVLRTKRESGKYCSCPPFGYRKAEDNNNLLVPDANTAPTVQLIFQKAAAGDSSRKIADYLNENGLMPPLKYRALYRDDFGEAGASRASDFWNATTVKRILRNEVYLGHTLLGKVKKVSIKWDKKIPVPKEKWAVTQDTHEPLVSQDEFDMAQRNMAHNTKSHDAHPKTRKSIFGKVAFCALCGHAMCSGGSVYKGERDKYWYLVCNNIREKGEAHCDGARIKYSDILEVVRNDINSMLAMSLEELEDVVAKATSLNQKSNHVASSETQIQMARQRLASIDKIVGKLYRDNAEGNLSDDRLKRLVAEQEKESLGLQKQITMLEQSMAASRQITANVDRFHQIAKQYAHIETLDRETLLTFVERIEIGPKILPNGLKIASQKTNYRQEIKIFYRFLGDLEREHTRDILRAANY